MENFDEKALVVSETPHLRSHQKTSGIMYKVFFALCPAAIWGVVAFGLRALLVLLTAIAASLLSEVVFNLIVHRESTINDGSALVTGLLIGMNVTPAMADGGLWKVALGSVFAIIVVKQLFGGLGNNFMNPALAARAFLMASFAGDMTAWQQPFSAGAWKIGFGETAVTCATPLAQLKEGVLPDTSLLDMFFGKTGGCIGEVSALLLLLGALYLIVARVIRPHIPVAYILTVAIVTYLLYGFDGKFVLASILSGGLILGAFFMATDYVTSPLTGKGMIAAGILCGLLTCAIRKWGGYPEGVSYSILLMNVATPLIDKVFKNKRFGGASVWQKKQKA